MSCIESVSIQDDVWNQSYNGNTHEMSIQEIFTKMMQDNEKTWGPRSLFLCAQMGTYSALSDPLRLKSPCPLHTSMANSLLLTDLPHMNDLTLTLLFVK